MIKKNAPYFYFVFLMILLIIAYLYRYKKYEEIKIHDLGPYPPAEERIPPKGQNKIERENKSQF